MSTDTTNPPAPLDAGVQGPRPGSPPTTAPLEEAAPLEVTAQNKPDVKHQIECAKPSAPVFLHSPPDSNNATKSEGSDSELSDLEGEPTLDDAPTLSAPTEQIGAATEAVPETANQATSEPAPEIEEDIGEVLPDDWSGAVPIFRPTWHQFKDFQKFMKKVDCYGMKSGIIKIIPPQEWKDQQPPLDDLVKHIRVREPIKQDIMGSSGTYRQVNILHGRSYNVPQWRQLCEQSEHQPPARRGERRANADKPKPPRPRPAAAPKTAKPSTPKKRGRGRPPKNKGKKAAEDTEERPMTPVSPKPEQEAERNDEPEQRQDEPVKSIEEESGDRDDGETEEQPTVGRMGGRMGGAKPSKSKTQSVSARRKYSRREGSAMIDEEAFKDFDYRMDVSDFTPERCEELERAYWKTLTYAAPLYGADMMGTLFDDRTETWNLNKLPNLLDVLGTKIPGVNTAYLYLGMWKATFAWHLEDVDLYSINYLHFGAPKQWYSISQADARRFEGAMKNVWPADAKACSQFLRHKGFLISPQHLLQHYGIRVNKVVSYPGEFVVTYPYGYHSGYNLGYNCAEAVNFALDTWLEMGKIAKRCECAQAQDSVWINVYEIERKLRGEETEYEETEDEEDDEDDEELSGLPTPPASHGVKFKDASKKRKRGLGEKTARVKVKKIKLRLKSKAEPPCCLCPNDITQFDLLPTDDGRKAHRLCALYLPETYIDSIDGKEVVCNAGSIHKDRIGLKCLFCRSKRGACFQCSQKKCARAYHPTCAAAAGVFVEDQDIPVFGEDGTEYKEQAFEFSCRFHRARRDKKIDHKALESDDSIRKAARALKVGEVCQLQYIKGEIFAGIVFENREDDETLLIDVLPTGDRIEVDWKWLLLPDASDYHLPKASTAALPLPASQKAKKKLNTKRQDEDKPRKDDTFAEGYTWAEFQLEPVSNKAQVNVDFNKTDQIWHYLGQTSTEARAQYTEDPAQKRHNPRGNFLDTVPKPPKPAPVAKPAYQGYQQGANGTMAPYVYKPRASFDYKFSATPSVANQYYSPYAQSPAAGPAFHSYNYQTSTYSQQPSGHATTPGAQANYHGVSNVSHQHSNGQLPTAPASHRPVALAPGQQAQPNWQVHPQASTYPSPYSSWGGYKNGQAGDPRAHQMANQNGLMQKMNPGSIQTPQGGNSHQNGGRPAQHGSNGHVGQTNAKSNQGFISFQATKPKAATPTTKTYKIPSKVTPVPLPPHVLAAMAASTGGKPPGQQEDQTRQKAAETDPPSGPMPDSATAPRPAAPLTQSQTLPDMRFSGPTLDETSADSRPLVQPAPVNQASVPNPANQRQFQEFADVPGSESMQFVERMMQNLRRASLHEVVN